MLFKSNTALFRSLGPNSIPPSLPSFLSINTMQDNYFSFQMCMYPYCTLLSYKNVIYIKKNAIITIIWVKYTPLSASNIIGCLLVFLMEHRGIFLIPWTKIHLTFIHVKCEFQRNEACVCTCCRTRPVLCSALEGMIQSISLRVTRWNHGYLSEMIWPQCNHCSLLYAALILRGFSCITEDESGMLQTPQLQNWSHSLSPISLFTNDTSVPRFLHNYGCMRVSLHF